MVVQTCILPLNSTIQHKTNKEYDMNSFIIQQLKVLSNKKVKKMLAWVWILRLNNCVYYNLAWKMDLKKGVITNNMAYLHSSLV